MIPSQKITVIMATHNGAPTLPLTLEALKRVRVPEAGMEIIAVDNASSDTTRDLLASAAAELPLKLLTEPRRGKSFALNRGLAAASGDLVVFIDDDVLPDEGWLLAYGEGADRQPEADLFAGQVRHFWQKRPPGWLERLAAEGRSYAGTPAEQSEGPVPAIFFKGLNFMVRRRVVENVRFSERAGVNFSGTTSSGGGEDTAFVQAALARGHKAHYLPAARVRHIVRPQQVGLRPVFQRYLRIGRSMTLNDPTQFDPAGARLLGYPRYLFRSLPRDGMRALGHWVSGDTHAAADAMIGIAMTCGRAQEWREMMSASPATADEPYGGAG